MTKFQVLIFFLAFGAHSIAQAPLRFVQTYHFPPDYNAQSYGVAETEYGYMLAGMSVDTTGYWAFTVSASDFNGNSLWFKRYPMASNQNICIGWYTHDYLKKYDEFYYATFYVHNDGTNDYTSFLVKLDAQGDTLWTKHLLGDAQDSILETRNFSKTNDGGFLICGLTGPLNGDEKCFLLKTDSLGNTQWKQKYNLSNQAEYAFAAIQDSITGKLVMVGHKNTASKSFVCILDSLGNLEQQQFFNSANGGHLYYVRQLSDGGFVAVGDEKSGNMLGGNELTRPMALKFNINGQLLWKDVSGYESIGNTFYSLLVENDNSFTAVGYTDTLYTLGFGMNGILGIRKYTSTGSIAWSRYIDVFNHFPSNGIFQSLIRTEDGGYAATGYDLIAAAPNPFVLIKLDVWGCLAEGCQTAGVDEIDNDFLVNIFPNPANENLIVALPENTLNTTCVLFDNLGKEVANFSVSAGDNNLNIKELQNGIYTIQVHSQKIKFIKN
ncbi:MAG: T9SS type A sorting domain-containing protein [Sediminibacterium sp.]